MRQSTGQASQTTMSPGFFSITSVIACRLQCRAHAVRRRRNAADADASRMVDGVEDRRRRRDQRGLADALGDVRAERFRILDEQTFDLGYVADRRNEIVVQILGAARQVLLHQSEADALRDAAMDLALDL